MVTIIIVDSKKPKGWKDKKVHNKTIKELQSIDRNMRGSRNSLWDLGEQGTFNITYLDDYVISVLILTLQIA